MAHRRGREAWRQMEAIPHSAPLPPLARQNSGEAPADYLPRHLQKGEVLARSAFSEILYLDSDSVPLSDPTFLFDSPTYKQNGAVLWPDFNRDAGTSRSPFSLTGHDLNI